VEFVANRAECCDRGDLSVAAAQAIASGLHPMQMNSWKLMSSFAVFDKTVR
jgi:hypothetical protein